MITVPPNVQLQAMFCYDQKVIPAPITNVSNDEEESSIFLFDGFL